MLFWLVVGLCVDFGVACYCLVGCCLIVWFGYLWCFIYSVCDSVDFSYRWFVDLLGWCGFVVGLVFGYLVLFIVVWLLFICLCLVGFCVS